MANAWSRAVLAEDEPILMRQLRDALAELWPDLAIVGARDVGACAIPVMRLLKG